MSDGKEWQAAFEAGHGERSQAREEFQALAKTDREMIPFLLTMLTREDDAKQLAALEQLQLLGDIVPMEDARDPFLRALEAVNPAVRKRAALALVPTLLAKDDAVLDVLSRLVKNESELQTVRLGQIFAISAAPKRHRALGVLKVLAESDPNATIRAEARAAWDDRHPVGALMRAVMDSLKFPLEEAERWVEGARHPVFQKMGGFGDPVQVAESIEVQFFFDGVEFSGKYRRRTDSVEYLRVEAHSDLAGKLGLFLFDSEEGGFFSYAVFRSGRDGQSLAFVPSQKGVVPKPLRAVSVEDASGLVDVDFDLICDCWKAQTELDGESAPVWSELSQRWDLPDWNP